MLRGAVKQLSSFLTSASSKQILSRVSSSVTITALPTIFLKEVCSACFHTSSSVPRWYDHERDSIRQKGVDVKPTAGDSQQILFTNETKKSFGGVGFTTAETFTQTFNGVPFNQVPIVHIKATSNNTIVSVTDGDGKVLAIQSAGTVGFRNARKGTNVAAQAAAIALADDALRKDVKQARVCVRGIGPGRFPALKAIEMSGIKVVSITDTTRLPHNGNRPKKVRRL